MNYTNIRCRNNAHFAICLVILLANPHIKYYLNDAHIKLFGDIRLRGKKEVHVTMSRDFCCNRSLIVNASGDG